MPRVSQAMRREVHGLVRGGLPLRARLLIALARCLPDFAAPSVRALLYRKAGFGLERGVALLGSPHLVGAGDLTGHLTIGEGCIIAPGVTFGLDGPITIGKNVSISPRAVLYTATHAIGFGSRRMSPAMTPRPIVVEDGVWVGMHALILPGVTLGRGCVVAAGSVVLQDVPPNTLVAGNPATVQQNLPFGNR